MLRKKDMHTFSLHLIQNSPHTKDIQKSLTLGFYPGGGGGGWGGGGGGVLRFGSDGGVPLKPPNPYPSLRVILAEKGTHYWFLFKKMMFLCTLATKWAKISSIYSKITKVGGMFRDFFGQKWGGMF